MVTAGPPPWANAGNTQVSYDPHEADRFGIALPQDFDPTLPVGPQYTLGDDAMDSSLSSATTRPDDVPTDPIYVAVSYGVSDTSAPANTVEPALPPETTPLPAEMEATIY
jgi:hypothetical protein